MLSFLARHKNPVLFGLAVVSILLVLSAQAGGRRAFETVRRGAAVLLVPLEQGGSVLWRAAAGRVEEVRELAGARQENDRLRQEINRLSTELARAGESEREAERLAALAQLARQTPVPTVSARVVARHPTNWFNAVTIDRGEAQGVEREAALLVPSGVVGRVVTVRTGSADAILITDPRSAIAVRNARTRDEAIMEGARPRPLPSRLRGAGAGSPRGRPARDVWHGRDISAGTARGEGHPRERQGRRSLPGSGGRAGRPPPGARRGRRDQARSRREKAGGEEAVKKANILALFLLVLVVQVVFVPHISIGGIQPDLPFLVAYAAGVHWGFLRGMAAGAGLGLLVDVAGGAAVGLSAMSGMMVGAAAGLLGGHVYRPTPAVHAGDSSAPFSWGG